MRQRVGFARGLVVHPNVLLMDEPFSALDVLTAETLRTDFLELWSEGQLPIKGAILVTHNIEEAVLMCDRILVFGSNPGRILEEIKIDLQQPRARLDPDFRDLVERIYVEMRLAAADTDDRKRLFAQHMLTYVALASHIRRVLDERPSHSAPWNRFSDEPEDHMSPAAAEQALRFIIDLGRYAEIFAYNDQTHIFSLENPGGRSGFSEERASLRSKGLRFGSIVGSRSPRR